VGSGAGLRPCRTPHALCERPFNRLYSRCHSSTDGFAYSAAQAGGITAGVRSAASAATVRPETT